MIHASAIIHPGAQIDPSACIGPYAIIDDGVVLGAGCCVGPHVHLTGRTVIGEGNRFHAGCVVGDAPQDMKYKDEPTCLRIGPRNVFREHVTVHRSNKLSEETVIGFGNFFMAHSHVGHNCTIGDQNTVANGALLAGHVRVMDRAFISGNCLLHQFVRVGTLAMMQGGAGISKDLPPYTVARGNNHISGLNTVGLRRAGFSGDQRLELRRLYHFLFRCGRRMQEALAEAREQFTSEKAQLLLDFIAGSHRGVCADSGRGTGGED
jgi:UDP-N-acetylglucosamine acyltransferase